MQEENNLSIKFETALSTYQLKKNQLRRGRIKNIWTQLYIYIHLLFVNINRVLKLFANREPKATL